MTLSSWEVIMRRTWLMAQGRFTDSEGVGMVSEKISAILESAVALTAPPGIDGMAAVLEPWHRRATANARRLRRD